MRTARVAQTVLSGHRSRSWALSALLAASPGLLACQRASQLRECGRIISTINESLRELPAPEPTKDSSLPTAPAEKLSPKRIEATYKRLARDLGQLNVRSAELRVQVGAYQALLNRAAKAVNALARGRSDKDATEIDEATQSLAQIKSSALGTSTQIGHLCRRRY